MIPAKYWSPTKKLMLLGAMAGGKAVEDTATGNPLTFLTDLARPLKSLLIPFTPKQTGSGDPSPSNIRPIVPWDGLTVWLSRETATFVQGGIVDSTGRNSSTSTRIRTDYIPVSCLTENTNPVEIFGIGYSEDEPIIRFIHFYDAEKTWIRAISTDLIYNKSYLIRREQIPEESEYFRVSAQKDRAGTDDISPDGIVLFINNRSETDISFPFPAYGGTLDAVTGVLTVNRALFDLGSIDWDKTNRSGFSFYYKNSVLTKAKKFGNGELSTFVCSEYKTSKGADIYSGSSGNYSISMLDSTPPGIRIRNDDCSTAEELKEALNGIMLVYELATPQEIQLTPSQITALVGNNTIWSDADGSMTAIYFKKG